MIFLKIILWKAECRRGGLVESQIDQNSEKSVFWVLRKLSLQVPHPSLVVRHQIYISKKNQILSRKMVHFIGWDLRGCQAKLRTGGMTLIFFRRRLVESLSCNGSGSGTTFSGRTSISGISRKIPLVVDYRLTEKQWGIVARMSASKISPPGGLFSTFRFHF